MNWKALKVFNETPGWCPLDKAEYLYKLVQEHKPETALEIGIYMGKSLFPMALAMRDYGGKAIAIEPFSLGAALQGTNPKSNDDWWGDVDYEKLEKRVKDSIIRYGLGGTIQLIKKTSKEAFADMPKELGIIHQDSNHSEEVSFWETKHYAPLLAKDGFYILDDIDWKVGDKLTNTKSIALLDKLFTRVHWVDTGDSQWGAWQNV